MGKDVDDYLRLVNEEGIGVLNDEETALEREIEEMKDDITSFVEDAQEHIESRYPGTSEEAKSDLLDWIEAGIPGESPHLYESGGIAQKYAERVMPRLFLADEENRGHWIAIWELVHNHRQAIKDLKSQLSTIRQARTKYLLADKEAGRSEKAPETTAEEVFEERTRTKGNTQVHSDVKEWAEGAFYHFYSDVGAEKAKDRVQGIAESHDYHFSRRSLERWIKE